MKTPAFPRIRSIYAAHEVNLTWAADEQPVRYCADRWCDGSCGLPALVIPASAKGPELVLRSSAVAVGNVFGPWDRTNWSGVKVEVPPEHVDDLRKRVWW